MSSPEVSFDKGARIGRHFRATRPSRRTGKIHAKLDEVACLNVEHGGVTIRRNLESWLAVRVDERSPLRIANTTEPSLAAVVGTFLEACQHGVGPLLIGPHAGQH